MRRLEGKLYLAAQHGIMVSPIRQFWHNKKNVINNMVMLGFGGFSEDEIVAGIKCLRVAWFSETIKS